MLEVMDVYFNLFLILINCSKDWRQGTQGPGIACSTMKKSRIGLQGTVAKKWQIQAIQKQEMKHLEQQGSSLPGKF